MKQWYESENSKNHILVASRVRLARNLYDYPFSLKLDDQQAKEMVTAVQNKFFQQLDGSSDYYEYVDLMSMEKFERKSLSEQQIITPVLSEKKQYVGLIGSKDGSESIMINEDDHIRIQAISLGNQLAKSFNEVNRLDDLLSERMEYAYNHKYGYITSCPTSIGTGMRASYLMHLPFLERQKLIKPLTEELNRLGYMLKGAYGTSEVYGSLYLISNQKTLGMSEKDIIMSLENMMIQVTDQERKARNRALRKQRSELEDKAYKSYGILKYGKSFSMAEAMNLLSDIRWGFDENILSSKDGNSDMFSMMIRIQPYTLMKRCERLLHTADRRSYRANVIHDFLPEIYE